MHYYIGHLWENEEIILFEDTIEEKHSGENHLAKLWAIMKDFCAVASTRSHIIKALGRTMRRKIRSASGKDSLFHKDIEAIKSFNWDSYRQLNAMHHALCNCLR